MPTSQVLSSGNGSPSPLATPITPQPKFPFNGHDRSPFPDPGSASLLDYWEILRRYKRGLLLMALIGTLAGGLITIPQSPTYRAHSKLEIQGLNEDFLNIHQVNPVSEGSPSAAAAVDIQTQIQLLESD